MPKTLIILVILLFVLTTAIPAAGDTEIPPSARSSVQDDYSEWIQSTKLAGPCEAVAVAKVEWIEPRGVSGKRPVVWLKTNEGFAAILGLTNAQAEWISGTVMAQPVMVLRDVAVYRLCRFWNEAPW